MQHGTRVPAGWPARSLENLFRQAAPALAFSEAPANILSLTRQPEIRTYISGAAPNTALLRLSGQHGAATGAIR